MTNDNDSSGRTGIQPPKPLIATTIKNWLPFTIP